MNISKAKNLVKFVAKAQIKSGVRTPIFFWGVAGIGKTALVRQATEELAQELIAEGKYPPGTKVRYQNMRLATKPDAGDLVGLPQKVETLACPVCADEGEIEHYSVGEFAHHIFEEHKGIKYEEALKRARTEFGHLIEVRTDFTAPRDLPMKGPAILFLDEVNRANRSVVDAVFTLLEDGRAGSHQLPQDVIVMCAGNPPTDDYHVQDVDQEKAFMERAIHVLIRPQQEEWLDYAFQTNHNEQVIKAVVQAGEFLGTGAVDADFMSKLKAGPRNMSKVSHLMNMGITEAFGTGDDFQEILAGIIGPKDATNFRLRVLEKEQPVSANDVLNNWGEVKGKVEQYTKANRIDLLYMTNFSLVHSLTTSDIESTKVQLENLAKYVLAQPKDSAFGFFKLLFRNGPGKEKGQKVVGKLMTIDKNVNKFILEMQKEFKNGASGA